jgi:hypothetical protein
LNIYPLVEKKIDGLQQVADDVNIPTTADVDKRTENFYIRLVPMHSTGTTYACFALSSISAAYIQKMSFGKYELLAS